MLSGKPKNKYLHACTILSVHFGSKLELGYIILILIFKIEVMVFEKKLPSLLLAQVYGSALSDRLIFVVCHEQCYLSFVMSWWTVLMWLRGCAVCFFF